MTKFETAAGEDRPNADQVAYWNGENGDKWARLQARIDALFVPITAAAVAAAAPRPGEHALDVGCGCGDTVVALAEAVGPLGRVTGVDVSAPMLAVAGRRIAEAGLTQAAVLEADAASEPFAPASLDLAFSRFGVMFFDAPADAFANVRRALKPGGRMVFACWRPFKANPWFHAPYKAAAPHLPEQEKADPEAPGPFSLAEPERVRHLLDLAGFGDVAVAPFDADLTFGAAGEVEDALAFLVQIGPVARALATGTDEQRAAALDAIRDRLRQADGPDGIKLGAQVWLVSARA